MRPAVLNPFFASATSLKGIGPKLEKPLARLVGFGRDDKGTARVIDLLLHLPNGVVDRSFRPLIRDLPQEGVVTVFATVMQHRPPPPHNRRVPYRIEIADETGHLSLVYFHAFADHLKRILPGGERRYVSGRVEWFNGLPQIVHPDHVVTAEEFETLPKIEPIYPMTEGMPHKVFARAVRQSLDRLPKLPEWQDAAWLKSRHWPGFAEALKTVHAPVDEASLSPQAPPHMRLAYDELLANQLALALTRRHMKRASGRALSGTGEKRQAIIAALPFALTPAQDAALAEITRDMASPQRMLRLLQGDVGAGKTIVALLALATAIESGAQGALMVPTEILARQHFATIAPLCKAAGIRVQILTGRDKGQQRESTLEALAEGRVDLIIGTHALFQDDVTFRDLGLAVIDEQHRFGVHQRLALQAKAGQVADLLVMTATPIPRTLALTVYGDMDVSKLTGKPAGRQPVDTRTIPLERIDEVVQGLRRAIIQGARIYWVCPLVEESEIVDLAAAEERRKALELALPGLVGIVHGRMKGPAKDQVMAQFKSGEISVLVSTTVIEVGVDVPEATIMVIENAERFGLAQLHQLRGRVGRGRDKSTCILLYQGPLGETAKSRLNIMRETEDGFVIAEEDLRLRGAGELLGVRQSGLPVFRLADLSAHGELLAAARDDVSLVLSRDAQLTGARGEALRLLLHLFERDDAVRLLSSG
jgi:ATP-dependent DNA helicase RecG